MLPRCRKRGCMGADAPRIWCGSLRQHLPRKCAGSGTGYAPLKGRGELHRWRCRPCTPLFLWSCQRKSAVRRGERKALYAANSASAGCLFAWLWELLVRTAFGLLSVPYRVRCTQFRAEVLPRIWRLGCGLWVVEESQSSLPRCRYPAQRGGSEFALPGVESKGGGRGSLL